jgi:hypothetical protein
LDTSARMMTKALAAELGADHLRRLSVI